MVRVINCSIICRCHESCRQWRVHAGLWSSAVTERCTSHQDGGLERWDINCPSSAEIKNLAASLSWKRLLSPNPPWLTSLMWSATRRPSASPVELLLHCRAPSWPLTLGRRQKWPGRGPAVGSGVRSVPISENCKISMKFNIESPHKCFLKQKFL